MLILWQSMAVSFPLTRTYCIPLNLGAPFSSSAIYLTGLTTPRNRVSPIEGLIYKLGDPIPQADRFFYPLPSIHSGNLFEE